VPVLTAPQIAQYAYNAGFRGDGLVWSIAVAEAESGGNTTARNVNSDPERTTDRGLWQLNSKWHSEVSDAQADDPASAAAAAFRISAGGRSWAQWSTYPAAASRHLGEAKMAAASVDTSGATNASFNPLDPFGLVSGGAAAAGGAIDGLATAGKSLAGMATMAAATAEWIANPHNWMRVVEVLGGIAALIGGVYLLSKTGAGPMADTAATVTHTITKAAQTAGEVAVA
jgi:hypothetical protein